MHSKFPGCFEEVQTLDTEKEKVGNCFSFDFLSYTRLTCSQSRRGSVGSTTSLKTNQLVLVVFLGGVTFAEVSAIRFLPLVHDGKSLHSFAERLNSRYEVTILLLPPRSL
jgi:hypothetical protein